MEMRLANENETMQRVGQISRRLLLAKQQNFNESQMSVQRNERNLCRHNHRTQTLAKTNSRPIILVFACLLGPLVQLAALTFGQAQATMDLPDGIENMLGFVPRSTFKCERDGYFGDIDNDCRIFHLCQKQESSNGRIEWRHWTYACGNQTMFNQLTLTCAFVDEAIPCRHASQFQYLNEVINKPSEPFLTDADVTSGFSYYSNRIMSDGARARAFQDSQLLAQIGGQTNSGSQSQENSANQQQQFSSSANERVSLIDDENNAERSSNQQQLSVSNTRMSSLVDNQANTITENRLNQLDHSSNNFQPQQVFHSMASAQASHHEQQAPNINKDQEPVNSFSFALATNHDQSSNLVPKFQALQNSLFQPASQSPQSDVLTNSQHSTLAVPPPQSQPQQQQPPVAATERPISESTTTKEQLTSQFESSNQANTVLSSPTTTTLATLTSTLIGQTQAPGTTEASSLPTSAATTATPTTTTSSRVMIPNFGPMPVKPARNSQQPRRQTSRSSSSNGRTHLAFQSTRLSAATQNQASVRQQQQQQQQPSNRQQPLVMRRSSRADVRSDTEFWRQSSHQFVAPQFDSMIMPRRV